MTCVMCASVFKCVCVCVRYMTCVMCASVFKCVCVC